jgi:hypothetical protein
MHIYHCTTVNPWMAQKLSVELGKAYAEVGEEN